MCLQRHKRLNAIWKENQAEIEREGYILMFPGFKV